MSGPTVANIRSRVVKTYWIALTGGEVRPVPYSSVSGRTYRVRRIVVTKVDGNVSSVELSGPVLKKDGTEGANDGREHLYSQKDWPLWLGLIVRVIA